VIRNAYDTYLYGSKALSEVSVDDKRPSRKRKFDGSHREVLYVPRTVIRGRAPARTTNKPLPGTQKLCYVKSIGSSLVSCSDLSCTCKVCLGVVEGPCFFGQYRNLEVFDLETGKAPAKQTHKNPSFGTAPSSNPVVTTPPAADTGRYVQIHAFCAVWNVF